MQLVQDQTELLNKDPGFVYKLVGNDRGYYGVRAYESRGWSIVMTSKYGPRFSFGDTSREGEPMENQGLVLMRQPKDVFERNEQTGGGTGLGQQYFDMVEDMIANPTQGIDGIARQGGQYAQIINETKPNRVLNADI